MPKKLTTEEFIVKAQAVHRGIYDYSQVEYKNANTKVDIICHKHGVFSQRPSSHLSGRGCPTCRNEKIAEQQTLSTEIFLTKARKIHGELYDYSKVQYKSMSSPVVITCRIHGDFEQTPNAHIYGRSGCPICGRLRTEHARKLTTADFICRACKIHNNKYDYSLSEYHGYHEKIDIICPEHGTFQQNVASHLAGHGCPQCGELKKRYNNKNWKGTDGFIIQAQKVHGKQYDYSLVDYQNAHCLVDIICLEHGIFHQNAADHLKGAGCPICGEIKRLSSAQKSLLEEELNDLLVTKFGNKDVLRQYKDDVRYPFHCDFYIKSKDLFIELNAYWSHGRHFFDPNNSDDLAELEKMENKKTKTYEDAIHTWTVRDPLKRKTAEENNLNYLVFWDNDLADAKAWLETQ